MTLVYVELYFGIPNKKEIFMSNLLSTKILVVSILVPVYSHEQSKPLHIQYMHYLVNTIRYILQTKQASYIMSRVLLYMYIKLI